MRTALPLLLLTLSGCLDEVPVITDAGEVEEVDAPATVTVRLAVYDHTYTQLDACQADMGLMYGEAYPAHRDRCDGLIAEYGIPVENLPYEVVVLDWVTATIGPPMWLEAAPSPQRWSVQVPQGWEMP